MAGKGIVVEPLAQALDGREDRFDSDRPSRTGHLVAHRHKTRKSDPRIYEVRSEGSSAKSQGGPYEQKVDRGRSSGNRVGDQRGCDFWVPAIPPLSQRKGKGGRFLLASTLCCSC